MSDRPDLTELERLRGAFLARFPGYGAEGCICGTHATPDPDCDLHFAIAHCDWLEDALLAEARKVETLTKERDLAIAHDRQPYPTAAAYEAVCKALDVACKQRDALAARVETLREALEATEADALLAPLPGAGA